MEILINLLKSSALLGLFFMIYYVFLRTDTLYQFKRFYFYSGLIFSAILPWIYFNKTVIIEKTSSAPIFVSQGNLPQAVTETTSLPIETSIDWYQVIFYVYLGITMLFLLWYLIRYFKIFLELNRSQFENKTTYKLHITSNEIGPFSFFKHIVINREDYESDNYYFILAHEATHSREWHSLDVLITNLACALFWFNPVMWMYRKHWLQNLEHIADQAATRNTNKKAYQYLLLNSVLGQPNVQMVTTTFFQPSIKQRIMMLNKPKTPKIFSLKSLIILPILILFVMNFQIKINAQEKKPLRNGVGTSLNSDLDSIKSNNALTNKGILIFAITKNADQEYLNRTKSALKASYGFEVNYSDIAYNGSGVLTSISVKVDCNDGFKGEAGNSLPNGINNLYVFRDYREGSTSPFGIGGYSELEIEKLLAADDKGGKRYIFSPEGLTLSERGSLKFAESSREKKSPQKVSAALKSVKYSDSVSTITTNYGSNLNTTTNTLTQRKQDPFSVNNYSAKPTFVASNTFVKDSLKKNEKVVVKIDRFASRDYLDSTKEFLSMRYNIDVNYTDIEYNDEGELVSIEAKVDFNDGFSASITQKDNSTINGFYIYRDYSRGAKKPFGLTSNLPSSFSGEKDSNKITYATTVMMTPPVKGFSKIDFKKVPQASNSTTATVNEVNLEHVKTFIINGETFNLSDISSQFLVVDSYFFVDDETFKVEGELISGNRYFDYLKSRSKDKDEVHVQNINIILFSNNKATFLNFKDIKITQNKLDKK